MDNTTNRFIYRLWAPIYDRIFGPLFARARQRAIALLDLQPGEHLLIPGVGTGLDLPLIADSVQITGFDLSAAMLEQARAKVGKRPITLLEMDATQLSFEDAHFDAAIFMLILSVVPDGASAFREAWRTLKPGGRAVIFDKFLPDDHTPTLRDRITGRIFRALGTDPNRTLNAIIGGVPDLTLTHQEASVLRGRYQIVVLRKASDK